MTRSHLRYRWNRFVARMLVRIIEAAIASFPPGHAGNYSLIKPHRKIFRNHKRN